MGRLRSRGDRGFTLIEMLVTLVIMSMISTLLWQAMQQVNRIERVLQSSGVEGQLLLVRREWLRGVLESSLVGSAGEEPQFRGNDHELQLLSAEALDLPGLGGGFLRLAIVRDEMRQRNQLVVKPVATDGSAASSVAGVVFATPLFDWVGPAAGIRYLDDKGNWLENWPPATPNVRRLPAAVMIDLGASNGGPILAALAVTELPRIRRTDWEHL